MEGDFVPQRIRRYIERIRNEPERLGSLKRTAGCSKLQITALESQLVEQEKCHLQQISQVLTKEISRRKDQIKYTKTFQRKAVKNNLVAQRGARTHDPEIKSLMLYRLS